MRWGTNWRCLAHWSCTNRTQLMLILCQSTERRTTWNGFDKHGFQKFVCGPILYQPKTHVMDKWIRRIMRHYGTIYQRGDEACPFWNTSQFNPSLFSAGVRFEKNGSHCTWNLWTEPKCEFPRTPKNRQNIIGSHCKLIGQLLRRVEKNLNLLL